MYIVNIYTSGKIPFIPEEGPLYNYSVTPGLYQLLKKMGSIDMELSDGTSKPVQNSIPEMPKVSVNPEPTVFQAEIKEAKKEIVVDSAAKEEEDKTSNSKEADEFLDSIDPKLDSETIIDSKIESTEDSKEYTMRNLEGLTKAQLKKILLDKGYTDGKLAPRYHDSLRDLKTKY